MDEMTDMQLAKLANHKLFKGKDRATVVKFVTFTGARIRQYNRGEIVLHKGDRLRSLIVVLTGRVNVIQPTRDGAELIDYTAAAGGVVGTSFVMQRSDEFPSRVQAAEKSELALIELGKLREAFKMPEFAGLFENIYRALTAVLVECQQKLSVIACWEISDKVLTYLERLAAASGSREVKIPFRTSGEFAQYLGVNRCAMSRSLSMLERKGILSHSGGVYTLLKGV